MKKLALISALIPLYSVADTHLELEPQKVTADKIVEAKLSNSKVITREEIELLQASNLSEVLNTLSGFQVTQQGGNAQTQSFVMNGYRSDQVLILLNGQRFSSATLGQTTYNTIPANIIERIEIVSNARSAIYGSDALGGVINIITQSDEIQDNNFQIALGNQNTSQLSTNLNAHINDLALHLSAFTEKTQGYDVLKTNDPDNDGSERHSLALGLNYKINDAQAIKINTHNNRGIVDYDGRSGTGRKRDYQQQVSNIGWKFSNNDLAIDSNYSQSYDKSWNYGNGKSRSSSQAFITENETLDLSVRSKLSDKQSLLLVSDYRKDNVGKSDAEYDKTTSSNTGLGLSHNYQSADINTELGIRHDNSSNFEDNTSYSASAQWLILPDLSITTAINTGFKAPSFNDLYYPTGGNKELKPEKSLNRRLAINYGNSNSIYEASYQHSHVDDLIQWKDSGGGIYKATNVNQALLRVTSLSWQENWSKTFNSKLSYDWNHSIDLNTHNLLQRQAARVAKLNLNYISSLFSLGSNVRYLSESYDNASNSTSLAAFTVVDIYGDVPIGNHFSIGLRVNNLTNREYETAANYTAQERTYLINGELTF